jgi:hypothetical protein
MDAQELNEILQRQTISRIEAGTGLVVVDGKDAFGKDVTSSQVPFPCLPRHATVRVEEDHCCCLDVGFRSHNRQVAP